MANQIDRFKHSISESVGKTFNKYRDAVRHVFGGEDELNEALTDALILSQRQLGQEQSPPKKLHTKLTKIRKDLGKIRKDYYNLKIFFNSHLDDLRYLKHQTTLTGEDTPLNRLRRTEISKLYYRQIEPYLQTVIIASNDLKKIKIPRGGDVIEKTREIIRSLTRVKNELKSCRHFEETMATLLTELASHAFSSAAETHLGKVAIQHGRKTSGYIGAKRKAVEEAVTQRKRKTREYIGAKKTDVTEYIKKLPTDAYNFLRNESLPMAKKYIAEPISNALAYLKDELRKDVEQGPERKKQIRQRVKQLRQRNKMQEAQQQSKAINPR